VDAVADGYLEALAAEDPVFATFTGIAGYDDRLTDFSPAGHARLADLARTTLAALDAAVPVDQTDAVTAAALHERLGLVLERRELGLDLADINNISSPVQLLRDIFDITPTATVEDWSRVADRLAAVQGAVAGYRESLEAALGGGWTPPARQVRAGATQARQFGRPDGFYVTFGRKARTADDAPLPDEVRSRLDAGAAAAAATYTKLADWLEGTLLPAATDRDAVGRDRYAVHTREFLGTVVDVDETYAWGLEELARVERRMAEVARRVAPDAPSGDDPAGVQAAIAAGILALDADPARSIAGAEAFRDWMQQVSDRAVEELGRTHFDIPSRCGRCAAASRRRRRGPSTTRRRRRTSRARDRCGGRCRRAWTRSRRGARPPPSTTRAYRAITCSAGRFST
jgi:uncharacterized protein (DUF885 family)